MWCRPGYLQRAHRVQQELPGGSSLDWIHPQRNPGPDIKRDTYCVDRGLNLTQTRGMDSDLLLEELSRLLHTEVVMTMGGLEYVS